MIVYFTNYGLNRVIRTSTFIRALCLIFNKSNTTSKTDLKNHKQHDYFNALIK